MLALRPEDLLLITADHGNDPTIGYTDHTREYVPILMAGSVIPEELNLGTRSTFADVAATIAEWLGVSWDGPGQSCLC
jgi:phosphopentomutase